MVDREVDKEVDEEVDKEVFPEVDIGVDFWVYQGIHLSKGMLDMGTLYTLELLQDHLQALRIPNPLEMDLLEMESMA